ncbi:trypsin-like serine protease [Austwickia chelonae]|uniref:trypsin-like serine protease n=1 Tax=Austwickia chelonae TaxID=100225 RepID=UPI003898F731
MWWVDGPVDPPQAYFVQDAEQHPSPGQAAAARRERQCLCRTGSPGSTVALLGWGTTREKEPLVLPDRLRQTDIVVQSHAVCTKVSDNKYNPGTDLCAGAAGRGSGKHDSGGPLIRKHNGRIYQVGVVSWGLRCGMKQYPGFYTSTTSEAIWKGLGR